MIEMDLIGCIDSSTGTFDLNEANATITNFNGPREYRTPQFSRNSQFTNYVRDPSYNALISFDRAKLLYTLWLIKYSKLIGHNISVPQSISENLEILDMASQHLIKSSNERRKSLAEENRLFEEFLADDFIIEIPPIEEFEIKARIVFEEGQPDLSGLEEF